LIILRENVQKLQENVISTYKDKGRAWLQSLLGQLAMLEDRLQITLESPLNPLTYHYLAAAKTQNGDPVVLKCGVPTPEFSQEIAALKFYNGQGAVHLIDANADEGWLLIERCHPGVVLSSLNKDDERTRIAVEVMQHLWRPVGSLSTSFNAIETRLDGLKKFKANQSNYLLSQRRIDYAIDAAYDLLTSQSETVLLHGDLHHDNILRAEREPWLAIDPKGVIGEREYEMGALLRNPQSIISQHHNLKVLFKRRIDIITEMTGFYRKRLLLWSFVQAVLSAWWTIEDGVSGTTEMIRVAQVFYDLYQERHEAIYR